MVQVQLSEGPWATSLPYRVSLSKGGFPLPRNFNVRTYKTIYVRKK